MRGSYRNILWLSGGIIVALTLVSGCLFQQNKVYESENRRLILQNDSIISVNIELQKNLKEHSEAATKPSSRSNKEENQQ